MVFAIFAFEVVEPLRSVVEGLGLEDEAEEEGDRAQGNVHPVDPDEAHGRDDVATGDAADKGAEGQEDGIDGL